MQKRNRVVITGLGVLAANGTGVAQFWDTLCRGESGIGPVTLCDVTDLPCKIAGEVKNFRPEDYLDGKIKPKRLSRTSQLAVAAAKMAFEDAGLDVKAIKRDSPVSILVGISLGGFDFIEREIRRITREGPGSMRPAVIGCQYLLAPKSIAEVLGIEAHIETLSNTCIGGLDAIARGTELIKKGECDLVIAGGTDAPVETSLMAGFSSARMLSSYRGDPSEASRPFDRFAEGGVLAEGSGMVVLERLDSAMARGVKPYAEIAGSASDSDPAETAAGSGLRISMTRALQNAGWSADQVEAINAHGPGETEIDRSEIEMIEQVFGVHADKVPVHSIKGHTGNPLSAGGAAQIIAAALGLRKGMIPPTINHDNPIEGCNLNIICKNPVLSKARRILINAHGMGGVNTSMLIEGCDNDSI